MVEFAVAVDREQAFTYPGPEDKVGVEGGEVEVIPVSSGEEGDAIKDPRMIGDQ